jgi:hypothetical protein
MSGGWRNSLMQNQTDFIALDGCMVLAASIALTLFHPGYCFPQMVPGSMDRVVEAKRGNKSEKKGGAWKWIRGGKGQGVEDEKGLSTRSSDNEGAGRFV